MMRTAISKNLFQSYQVGSQKEEVNILQYADDTLFFGSASTDNIRVLKSVLRIFEIVSGLKINYAKSQFGCLGKSELMRVILPPMERHFCFHLLSLNSNLLMIGCHTFQFLDAVPTGIPR